MRSGCVCPECLVFSHLHLSQDLAQLLQRNITVMVAESICMQGRPTNFALLLASTVPKRSTSKGSHGNKCCYWPCREGTGLCAADHSPPGGLHSAGREEPSEAARLHGIRGLLSHPRLGEAAGPRGGNHHLPLRPLRLQARASIFLGRIRWTPLNSINVNSFDIKSSVLMQFRVYHDVKCTPRQL